MKFQLDQFKNGRLSAIIYFIMLQNKMCDFMEGCTLKNVNLNKFKWPTCGHH